MTNDSVSIHQPPIFGNTPTTLHNVDIAISTIHVPTGQPRSWAKFNDSFATKPVSVDELIAHIRQGHNYTSPHRHERHTLSRADGSEYQSAYRHTLNWESSQHLGLDFDEGGMSLAELAQNPFIAQYAAFLHTTRSHTPEAPRTRAVFIADRPFASVRHYSQAAQALVWKFSTADKSCKDPARFFYGARDCEIVRLDNVMGMTAVDALIAEWEHAQQPAPPSSFDGETTTADVRAALACITYPPGYAEWRDICWAVHAALDYDTAAAESILKAWRPEEKTGEYATVLGHDRKAGVGAGTLFHIAKQNGYRRAAQGDPEPGRAGQLNLHSYAPEDGGILDAWRELYADNWLYVTGYDSWYQWTGTHWAKDEARALQGEIQALMVSLNSQARALLAKGGAEEDKGRYRAFVGATKRSSARVASVCSMAQSWRVTRAADLDAGNVLNLRNGTLDLNTYELRPHNRDDHLTYCLDYDYNPTATAPHFYRFMESVFVDESLETDTDLCQLVQELIGYSLTTDTRHEVMTWLHGHGSNGKTVLISVLRALLGPMACNVNFQHVGESGNYDLAEIPGRRIIFSTEAERGGRVAEGYLKRIVSGERISARAIYGSPFEFDSVAKIWWAMNDKPVVTDTSNAIWRRMKLIPFNRTFAEDERDEELTGKLLQELPGILNFAIRGLVRLRERGKFIDVQAVTDAIQQYKHESNPVAQWVDECTTRLEQPTTGARMLYSSYCAWAQSNGRQSFNSTNFGIELGKLGIAKKRSNSGNQYAIEVWGGV